MLNRRTLVGALAVVAAGLTGCTSSVSMDNQSDSWLNVRYYIATPSDDAESVEFVAYGRQQVEPGSSSSYDLTGNPSFSTEGGSVIHVQVEPATASWEESQQYWFELLTPAPLTMSVSGKASELKFTSEDGQFSEIPEKTLTDGRFHYTTLAAPEPESESTTESVAEHEDASESEHDESEAEVAEVSGSHDS